MGKHSKGTHVEKQYHYPKVIPFLHRVTIFTKDIKRGTFTKETAPPEYFGHNMDRLDSALAFIDMLGLQDNFEEYHLNRITLWETLKKKNENRSSLKEILHQPISER